MTSFKFIGRSFSFEIIMCENILSATWNEKELLLCNRDDENELKRTTSCNDIAWRQKTFEIFTMNGIYRKYNDSYFIKTLRKFKCCCPTSLAQCLIKLFFSEGLQSQVLNFLFISKGILARENSTNRCLVEFHVHFGIVLTNLLAVDPMMKMLMTGDK